MNQLTNRPKLLLSTFVFLLGLSLTWSHRERMSSHGRLHRRTHQSNAVDSDADWTDSYRFAVEAPLNGNLFMHCPVTLGEDFQVSWVRLPDWRIISSGRTTYTNDERVRVLHIDGTNEWTLQIKYVNLSDHGLYECQVSTGTGLVTYHYNVTILVPSTSISEGGDYHVDKGSRIQLTCIIHNVPQLPQFVFWYHNERMINYDPLDGNRIEVRTETGPDGDQVISHLTIREASDVDSGNYTCLPSNSPSTSTLVFVSEGDEAAAIQGVDQDSPVSVPQSSSAGRCPTDLLILLLTSWLLATLTGPHSAPSSFFSSAPGRR